MINRRLFLFRGVNVLGGLRERPCCLQQPNYRKAIFDNHEIQMLRKPDMEMPEEKLIVCWQNQAKVLK